LREDSKAKVDNIAMMINAALVASLFQTVLRGELALLDPLKFQEITTRLGRTKLLLVYVVSFAALYLLTTAVVGSSTVISSTLLIIALLMSLIAYLRVKRAQKKYRRNAELLIATADDRLAQLAKLSPITDENLDAQILEARMKLEATRARLQGLK
jgi:hypothetical protein